MPTYEYQCSKCGHILEAFQSMSEKPLTECPKCNQDTLSKLLSPAGFQLKGKGWYVTDYSNKGKEKSTLEGGSTLKTEKTTKEPTPSSTTDTPKTDTSTKTGGTT